MTDQEQKTSDRQNPPENPKWVLKSLARFPALHLGLFTLACASLVTTTWWLTEARIQQSERTILQQRLGQIVPPHSFDNAMDQDVMTLRTGNEDITLYRARLGASPVAVVYDVITHQGYSGKIRMLVGIQVDGSISGVRILGHKETPGLGDDIEITRSDWITGFNGHSLRTLDGEQWKVRKDGGNFDQFTGATITPRAVVNAVHNTLVIHRQFGNKVYQP